MSSNSESGESETGEVVGSGQVIRNSQSDGSCVLSDLVRLGCRVRERPLPPLLGVNVGEGPLRCENAILSMLDGEPEADLMLRLGFENIFSRSSFVNSTFDVQGRSRLDD